MLTAIIVAAGSSERMGFDKLFALVSGKPIIAHTIAAFIIAALSMRKTPSLTAFFSRIAVFRSASIRWERLTPENYDAET